MILDSNNTANQQYSTNIQNDIMVKKGSKNSSGIQLAPLKSSVNPQDPSASNG